MMSWFLERPERAERLIALLEHQVAHFVALARRPTGTARDRRIAGQLETDLVLLRAKVAR